ncbi:MAG: response regulator [Dehalococcoidia bacterium]|nr:response regulator [Dehalococcoidia bacterium]
MTKGWRILMVDDDRQMGRTLVDILKLNGYQAKAAYSAREALAKVKRVRLDCILTDVKMPEMNGVDLIRAIKAMQPDLPVVLMTAYSTDKRVKEGLKRGSMAALFKPLDIDALLRLLSGLRQKQRMVTADDDLSVQEAPAGYILHRRGLVVIEVTDPPGSYGTTGLVAYSGG